MSEQSSNNSATQIEESSEAGEPTIFDQPEGTDWLLAQIIQLVEDTGLELGITFVVGGLIMSGMLINGHTYFKELGAEMRTTKAQAGSQEDGEVIAQALSEFVENFGQIYPAPKPDERRPRRGFTYVHLRDARIFSRSGAMPDGGVLWRGKLASIGGFSLGSLSAG